MTLAAPTGFAVSGTPTTGSVVFVWGAVTGAAGYYLERTGGTGDPSYLYPTPFDGLTLTDTTATETITYHYTLRAYDGDGIDGDGVALDVPLGSGAAPACVSYVNSATYVDQNRSGAAVRPAGAVEGDLLIAFVLGWENLRADTGDYIAIDGYERLDGIPNDAGTGVGDILTDDSIVGAVFVRTYQPGEPLLHEVTIASPYSDDAMKQIVVVTAWHGAVPITVDSSDAVYDYDSFSTNSGGGSPPFYVTAPQNPGVAGSVAVYGFLAVGTGAGPYISDYGTAREHTDTNYFDRALSVASMTIPLVDGFSPARQVTAVIADGQPYAGSLGFTIVLNGAACAPARRRALGQII